MSESRSLSEAGESIDVLARVVGKMSGGEGPPRLIPRLARMGLGARILLLTQDTDDDPCCVLPHLEINPTM